MICVYDLEIIYPYYGSIRRWLNAANATGNIVISMTDSKAKVIRAPGAMHPFARRSRPKWRWLWLSPLAVVTFVLLSHAVLGRPADGDHYAVSVPVTLKPYDPQLWSLVNAENFEAARAIDPNLPDPNAVAPILPPADATAAGAPIANLETLKQQAFIGPAAQRYVFRGATATDTARAHYCLTSAVYYEAANQSDDGMRAVAQVVLNRTRHPSFPGSVCGVVFQGSQRAMVCQFTFSCDGSMARAPARANWARASRIAAEALAGRTFPGVGLATHYHTTAIWPSWGKSLMMTNVVGDHIFHRWRGRFGELAAFSRPYSGHEPAPGPYLPIAQQLAARAGRLTTQPLTLPTTLPGSASVPGQVDAATMAAINAAGSATASQTTPTAAGAVPATPGFAAAPAGTQQPAAGASYADPRLSRSGTVREEYQNSGSSIRR